MVCDFYRLMDEALVPFSKLEGKARELYSRINQGLVHTL
jgi:hypothetical protein